MTQAMHNLAEQAHPAFPVTIYYAFKQARVTAPTAQQHRLGHLSGGRH
jgi:adenine-specific DNA methylase